jgi:hypothetical protein
MPTSGIRAGKQVVEKMFEDLSAQAGLKVDKTWWLELTGDYDRGSISFIVKDGDKEVSESFPSDYLKDIKAQQIEPMVAALVKKLKMA